VPRSKEAAKRRRLGPGRGPANDRHLDAVIETYAHKPVDMTAAK